MKTCLICGYEDVAQSFTCPMCGEATWSDEAPAEPPAETPVVEVAPAAPRRGKK